MLCPTLSPALERSAGRLIEDYGAASAGRGATVHEVCSPDSFAAWVAEVIGGTQRVNAVSGDRLALPSMSVALGRQVAPFALGLVAAWDPAQNEEAAAWELVFSEIEVANAQEAD